MRDIVIKPADKGSAVVIQDREDYINEAMRQLSNPVHYMPLEEDLTWSHSLRITAFLQTMLDRDEITQKIFDYLRPLNSRTPQFYLLPKIHKSARPPPGRPILSANGCPTERISKFVDHFLQPLVTTTKSYIKDTTHFLQLMENLGVLPENTLIITLDVTSLYTNIPIEEGKRAVARFLSRNPTQGGPWGQSIITLLDMVLKMNNFQFNGKNFLQISGTAMGTKCAPSFANLFMADFEERHIYTYPTKPIFWGRFIDDIISLWNMSDEEGNNLVTYLNSLHPTIKFTAHVSRTEATFLDTKIILTPQGHIATDLYVKPTDAHNYLLFSSAHTPSCKRGIPYGQFLRVRRICTRLEDFDKHALDLAKHFVRRGYPKFLIEKHLLKARRQDRTLLLNHTHADRAQQSNDSPQPFFFISTFHPGLHKPGQILLDNKDMLARHTTTLPLYKSRIILGYRRSQNLRDLIIRAKLPCDQQESDANLRTNPSSHKCLSPSSCRYCPRLSTTGNIISHSRKLHYKTKTKVSCNSNNIVYCIECTLCHLQYVGETKRSIKERFAQHFYNITTNNKKHIIGNHFNEPNHNGLDNVIIHILEFIHLPPDNQGAKKLRLQKESSWIHTLRTLSPQGLNIMDTTSW